MPISNAENRLVTVTGINGTNLTATFDCDGNGQRVKSVINGVTTLFIGGYYEVLNPGPGQAVTRYYFAGAFGANVHEFLKLLRAFPKVRGVYSWMGIAGVYEL